MFSRNLNFCICLLLLSTFAVSSHFIAVAKAEKSATPASDFLKVQVAAVLKLSSIPVDGKNKAKLDEELLALIKPMMDFPAMSKASLGKHWDKQSTEQQQKFISLFQELVFHSYINKIRKAKNEATIAYEDESTREKGGATVEAVAETKQQEIELKFLLRAGNTSKKEAQYVAEDVFIDEVSLVNNYREEFNKIITKDGFSVLIEKMEKQVKKVK